MFFEKRSKFTTERAREMEEDMPAWRRNLRRQVAREGAEKKETQLELLMNPEKVAMFRNSAEHRTCIKIIGNLNENSHVDRAGFTTVRNVLILNMFLRNANRAGCISSLTVSAFSSRVKIMDRDTGYTDKVIQVVKHNTLGTAGAANIVVNSVLEKQLQLYLQYMQPKVATEESIDNFFLCWGGKPFESSSRVSSSLASLTTKIGIGRITPNIMRKSTSTRAIMMDPSQEDSVIRHMNQSKKTAEEYYRIYNKADESTKASNFIASLYGPQASALLQPSASSVPSEFSPTFPASFPRSCNIFTSFPRSYSTPPLFQHFPLLQHSPQLPTLLQHSPALSEFVPDFPVISAFKSGSAALTAF